MGVIGLAEGVSKTRTSLQLDVNPHNDGFSSAALALGMWTQQEPLLLGGRAPAGAVLGAGPRTGTGIPSWGAQGTGHGRGMGQELRELGLFILEER